MIVEFRKFLKSLRTKAIAKELDVPLIAYLSFQEKLKMRGKKTSTRRFKKSGSIEQDADLGFVSRRILLARKSQQKELTNMKFGQAKWKKFIM